jgi:hypothetical protein
MMRLLRVTLCAMLLVLGSASAVTAGPGQPVPIRGATVGQDQEPVPGVYPGCEEVGAPLLWRFTSSGTGTVSHLGRVTYEFTHCTHVDFTITQGVLTLDAANGDVLVLDYTAAITQYQPGDPDALWEMSWTPAGGTGRFANAAGPGGTGYGVTHTPDSPLAGTTDLKLSGMIDYAASNRRGT